ncbi:hypothetical protein CTAYLR_009102 [Chrysophaeum taylorii]|uniref:Uncharacterized protein n=1 Tax=Chrysophaeum taylorii TaxID=2483200 RepID=A0AAD7UK65_9STRA|nr:hypothetical protein CTAYLR_009102 [Chrysophaeum taylorii]
MMEQQQLRVVRLRFGGRTRFVNLWSGCNPSELRELIGAALGLPIDGDKAPVAIIADGSGLIVPLSVACSYPQTLDESSYSVLRADGTGAEMSVTLDDDDDRVAPATQAEVSTGDDEAKVKKLTDLICKFARLMESHGRLTRLEADTVEALASKRDTVVLAAYAVAAADQDADYLLALVRNVARDYLRERSGDDPSSFDGPAEHAVAEQLLRVIDELFVSKRFQGLIDMPKCRYLQKLVLEKDPAIFAAFDVYAEDGDLDELFDTLVRISLRGPVTEERTAPAQAPGPLVATQAEEDEKGEDAKEPDDFAGDRKLMEERRLAVFRECMVWLVDKNIVDSPSANALLANAAMGNERLREALDAYGTSGDLEKFLETLAVVAKDLGNAARAPTPAAATMDDRQLVVFRECVTWLLEKDIIEASHAETLIRAAAAGDPRLRAALDAYAASTDLGKFLETLSVMARVMRTSDVKQTIDTAGPAADVRDDDDDGKKDDDDDDDDARIVDKGIDAAAKGSKATDDVALKELIDLISCLVDEGKLTDDEHRYLSQLLVNCDARLLAAYDVYVESQDVAALQLCAARNDTDLAAVLQVFRVEGDQSDLEDSLKRIARKTIEEAISSSEIEKLEKLAES